MMNRLKGGSFPVGAEADFLDCDPKEFFDKLFHTMGLRRSDIIRQANIGRTYGHQILNGTRKGGRDYYLSIAIAMHLDLSMTQRMLAVTGAGDLHPLIQRDAAVIYAINHNWDNTQLWTFMKEKGIEPLDTHMARVVRHPLGSTRR